MTNSPSFPNNSKEHGNSVSIPLKPWSQYNIFFRLERKYILHSSSVVDEGDSASLDPNHYDPVEFPRPAKYAILALPPYWYSRSHNAVATKKRLHRKRKGNVALETLSKSISAAWRSADQTVKQYCKKLAQSELAKYNNIIGREVKTQADATRKRKPLKQLEVFEDAVPSKEFTHTQAGASVSRLYTDRVLNDVASEVTLAGEIDQEDQELLNELNIQAYRQQLEAIEHNFNERCRDSLRATHRSPVPIAKHEGNIPAKKRKCNHPVSATSMPKVKIVDGDTEASLARNNRSPIHLVSAPQTPEAKIAKRKIESSLNMHITIVNANDVGAGDVISKQLDRPRNLDSLSQAFTEKRLVSLPFLSSQGIEAMQEVWSFPMDVSKQESSEPFSWIPEWERKDADVLLNILDVSQRSLRRPVSNDNSFVPLPRVQTKNQDVSNVVMDTLVSERQIDISPEASHKVGLLGASNHGSNESSSEIEKPEQIASGFRMDYRCRPCM